MTRHWLSRSWLPNSFVAFVAESPAQTGKRGENTGCTHTFKFKKLAPYNVFDRLSSGTIVSVASVHRVQTFVVEAMADIMDVDELQKL